MQHDEIGGEDHAEKPASAVRKRSRARGRTPMPLQVTTYPTNKFILSIASVHSIDNSKGISIIVAVTSYHGYKFLRDVGADPQGSNADSSNEL